jgi:peptidoglycan/xylan/chitin deacetylase (PgdA/CDA1 family)
MGDRFAVPVLAYHSLHAPGLTYGTSDHVALEEDLRTIRRLGLRVVPARAVADALVTGDRRAVRGRCVAITFDDGPDTDYHDVRHSTLGLIKGFRRILAEAWGGSALWRALAGRRGAVATSFVIASPAARTVLDRTCIAGRGDWGDGWWPLAVRTGLFHVGNHSWDHLHPTLPAVAHSAQAKGDFRQVLCAADADGQIRAAQAYIEARAPNPGSRLFAYPYGHWNAFLAEEYFPGQPAGREHTIAAFTTDGGPATEATGRWLVPRFVCGDHWKSPEELERLLRDATGR